MPGSCSKFIEFERERWIAREDEKVSHAEFQSMITVLKQLELLNMGARSPVLKSRGLTALDAAAFRGSPDFTFSPLPFPTAPLSSASVGKDSRHLQETNHKTLDDCGSPQKSLFLSTRGAAEDFALLESLPFPTFTSPAAKAEKKRRVGEDELFCKFCYVKCCTVKQTEGEPMPDAVDFGVWRTHNLHDSMGAVVCPRLYHTRCRNCGATGPHAHTTKYCPHGNDRFVPRYDRCIPALAPLNVYDSGPLHHRDFGLQRARRVDPFSFNNYHTSAF